MSLCFLSFLHLSHSMKTPFVLCYNTITKVCKIILNVETNKKLLVKLFEKKKPFWENNCSNIGHEIDFAEFKDCKLV